MIYFSSLMLSLFITLAAVPPLKVLMVRCRMVDMPNERKVHCEPIPKVGGVAMTLGCLTPVMIWAPSDAFSQALILASLAIFVFGFLDDLLDLNYGVKLAGQVIAALIIMTMGGLYIQDLGQLLPAGSQLPTWMTMPLTLLTIVGVTNAINLSDGLDGLAAGITLLCFACMGYLAWSSGAVQVVVVAVAVVGAIIGFLRFNSHPANIFMGDTGSQLLGFLAICLSLKVTQGENPLSPLLPLLILGFPVLDTLTVMTERIVKGHSPFKADKNHFHHKLLHLGFTHSESVFTIYGVQALLVTLALVFRFHSDWLLLGFYLVFSGSIVIFFVQAEKHHLRLQRMDIIDDVVASKVRLLRKKSAIIKSSFQLLEYGLPVLFLATCLIPNETAVYTAIFAAGMGALLMLSVVLNRWTGPTLRAAVYLTLPLIVFGCTSCLRSGGAPDWLRYGYTLACFGVCLLAIATLKYTRRTSGFRPSPLDFLILFAAVVVPNLPDTGLQSLHIGFVAMHILIFLFSYEVLIGELRDDLKYQCGFAAAALFALALKSIV